MNGADSQPIRLALAHVQRQLDISLAVGHGDPLEQESLRKAWSELVRVLALEPAPEVRACSVCGATVMRAATRCGYCWAELTSPARA